VGVGASISVVGFVGSCVDGPEVSGAVLDVLGIGVGFCVVGSRFNVIVTIVFDVEFVGEGVSVVNFVGFCVVGTEVSGAVLEVVGVGEGVSVVGFVVSCGVGTEFSGAVLEVVGVGAGISVVGFVVSCGVGAGVGGSGVLGADVVPG
jgi:hypothetical protein